MLNLFSVYSSNFPTSIGDYGPTLLNYSINARGLEPGFRRSASWMFKPLCNIALLTATLDHRGVATGGCGLQNSPIGIWQDILGNFCLQ